MTGIYAGHNCLLQYTLCQFFRPWLLLTETVTRDILPPLSVSRVGTAHHESTVELQALVGSAHPTAL